MYQEFKHFKHGKSSYTLWLHPEPCEKVQELQMALVNALPFFDDQNNLNKHAKKSKLRHEKDNKKEKNETATGSDLVKFDSEELCSLLGELPDSGDSELKEASSEPSSKVFHPIHTKDMSNIYEGTPWGLFTPHLSVGQWQKYSDLQEKKLELGSHWTPLEMVVDRIHIISRILDYPFEVRYTIKFGGEIIPGKVIVDQNDLPTPPEFKLFIQPLPQNCSPALVIETVKSVDPSIEIVNVSVIKSPRGACKVFGFCNVKNSVDFEKLCELGEKKLVVIGDKTVRFRPCLQKKEKIQGKEGS